MRLKTLICAVFPVSESYKNNKKEVIHKTYSTFDYDFYGTVIRLHSSGKSANVSGVGYQTEKTLFKSIKNS